MSGLEAVRVRARGAHERLAGEGRSWRLVAGALLVTNLLTAAALGGYVWLHSTVYVTVAASADGRLVEVQPLGERIMTDAQLRIWAATAVVEAYTLGHHDWRMRLEGAREGFTDEGFESFVSAMEESFFLERVREERQVASVVLRGTPVILETIVFGGRVGWKLEIPLLLAFEAGGARWDRKVVAEVLVLRVPYRERQAGMGIQQIVLRGEAGG